MPGRMRESWLSVTPTSHLRKTAPSLCRTLKITLKTSGRGLEGPNLLIGRRLLAYLRTNARDGECSPNVFRSAVDNV